MNEKDDVLIRIPERAELMARLASVSDVAHLREKLYTPLAAAAGSERYPSGILMWLQLGIFDYSNGLPPAIEAMLLAQIPAYVRAIIDDQGARARVLAEWDNILSASSLVETAEHKPPPVIFKSWPASTGDKTKRTLAGDNG